MVVMVLIQAVVLIQVLVGEAVQVPLVKHLQVETAVMVEQELHQQFLDHP
jgi:hypothetical protein